MLPEHVIQSSYTIVPLCVLVVPPVSANPLNDGVGVCVLVGVTVGVTVDVTVGVTVLVGVILGVTEGVDVTVGVTVLVGVILGVIEGVGVGVGVINDATQVGQSAN